MRFAFEGWAYQYKVLPFGLSLSPRVFAKVVEAALVPLRERGVRILNYLDDWLILAQSCRKLCAHRDLVLKHLSLLGLRVNWEKSKLVPMQRISFLGMELDSVNQTACLTQERAQSVLNCFMTLSGRTAVPLKLFQRLLGHMAAAAVTVTLCLLHMRPLQHWLHGRIPRWAWTRGTHRVQITPACRKTFSPWSDPSFLRAGVPLEQVSRHAVVFTDASATGWVPPSEPTSTDTVQDQGERGADLVIGSILPPCLVPGTHAPRDSPSLADSPEEGSAFSEAPSGTRVRTCGNSTYGPWMGRRGSR